MKYKISDNGGKYPGNIHHRSILISKLNDANQHYSNKILPDLFSDIEPMLLPTRHQYFGPDNLFPHFDPMFGLIDRMMDSLMQPIVNRHLNLPIIDSRPPRNNADNKTELPEPLTDRDGSSLKFWMQNEATLTTKPKILEKENRNKMAEDAPETDKLQPIELSTVNEVSNDDYPDYKTDLWRKFMKDEDKRSESDAKSNNTGEKIASKGMDNKFQNSDNRDDEYKLKSNKELIDEQDHVSHEGENKKKEDAWWYPLISPRKTIILRNRKRSSHGLRSTKPIVDYRGDNKSDELSIDKKTDMNTHQKQLKGDVSEEMVELKPGIYAKSNYRSKSVTKQIKACELTGKILEVAGIASMVTIIVLMMKLSLLFYREYNMARHLNQYDYRRLPSVRFTTQPLRFKTQRLRNTTYSNIPPPPPPTYSLHVPSPAPPADTYF